MEDTQEQPFGQGQRKQEQFELVEQVEREQLTNSKLFHGSYNDVEDDLIQKRSNYRKDICRVSLLYEFVHDV